ncbi:MAG: hypothetical protein MUF84_15120 [Anaerolineae bacterium]|nr:hypothetical protein [Anaerolineae bacterium]
MQDMRRTLICVIFMASALGLASSCRPALTGTPAPATVVPELPDAIEPTDSPSPTILPTEAQEPSGEEAQAAVVAALLALYSAPNRMTDTTSLGEAQPTTNVIEFVPPDRKRIASADQGVEYIVIGDDVYVNTKDTGTWEKAQIPGATFLGDGEVTAETISATVSDARWLRSEVLDETAVAVYSYRSTSRSGDVDLQSQTELWIGQDDGLPKRMSVTGETLSVSTDPSTGVSTQKAVQARSTILIEFDTTIRIEPPIP